MRQRRIGVVLIVLFLLGVEARAQTSEQQQETLRGLSGIAVMVEPLNAEAEQDGLSTQQLQAAVERQLHEAGMRVLSQRRMVNHPRWSVSIHQRRCAQGRMMGCMPMPLKCVSINWWPSCAIRKSNNSPRPGRDARSVRSEVEKLASLEQSVAAHVEAFVTAYRAVNPGQDDGKALRRNSEKQ